MSIPKVLWQTDKSIGKLKLHNSTLVKSWAAGSPSFDWQFMDDDQCDAFIKNNFNDLTYKVYSSLPLPIMKADMWRIAVVYLNGGVYADTDTFCIKDITPLLESKSLIVVQEHTDSNDVANFFFAAEKNHPVLGRTLELMIENYQIAFDAESELVVQNFGMNTFQEAVNEFKVKLLDREVLNKYVKHQYHGSWRDSQDKYRDSRHMTPVTFFTTFHEKGYQLYGKTWIDSFIKNVAPKSISIKAIIYTHNFTLEIDHPQIEIRDFETEIPEHKDWVNEFNYQSRYSAYVHDNSIRFSHKGFVINHALDTITDGYAIWLDGDCVMHDASYDDFPASLFSKNEVVACQLEHASGNNHHIESGFLAFNMLEPNIKLFKLHFKENYSIKNIVTMPEPYDGFVVYKSIISSKIQWANLNEKYGMGGIQSDPSLTFLHPEIKKRFTHNIGLTGKTQYTSWEDVKYSDRVFSQLASVGLLTGKELKINQMKIKRAKLLNSIKQ